CGFANYKRTLSTGKAGAEIKFSFSGTGFALFGSNESGVTISVRIDDVESIAVLNRTECREIFCYAEGLNYGEHNVTVTVICGELSFDGGQFES
ncbi:MAG: glycosyl hydrolase family 59, partial [Oscillospiraceae bacterium]|nr:glycosyl hydrolase family 59 [Oscillospiraceae bacterium]